MLPNLKMQQNHKMLDKYHISRTEKGAKMERENLTGLDKENLTGLDKENLTGLDKENLKMSHKVTKRP
jgi:hypothetical protein